MAESDFTKPSNVKRSFFIDWRKNLVKAWGPGRRYGQNEIVRAPTGTGFYYKVVDAGHAGISSMIQPPWSVDITATFKDGSIIWTTFHPDNAGLFTLQTSVWAVDPGITLVSNAIVGFLAELELDDGVSGQQYLAVNDIVTSTGKEAQDSIIIGVQDPVAV